MAEVTWTEPALADLDAIVDYIALDKPDAARLLVQKVFHKVSTLERFPKIGSVPREIKDLSYRQLVIPPCRVFYRVAGKTIFIVAVMRGEMEITEERLRLS